MKAKGKRVWKGIGKPRRKWGNETRKEIIVVSRWSHKPNGSERKQRERQRKREAGNKI